MITSVKLMTVYVLDQDKAHDTYVNKLGFNLHTDFTMDNGFRWLTVTAPEQPDLEILLITPVAPMLNPEQIAAITKLLNENAMSGGVLATNDCEKTYQALLAKGIEFSKPPTKEFYAIEALFKDGCGNWFSLSQAIEA